MMRGWGIPSKASLLVLELHGAETFATGRASSVE
jgi:hypothetical protein